MCAIKKMTIILILLTIIMGAFYPISNADGLSTIITQGESFVEAGQSNPDIKTIDGNGVKDVSDSIYKVLLAIGILVAVIVGAYIGIQFMIASTGDKAKIKEAILPYVAGCIVVFGSFGIWKLAVSVLGASGL